MDATTVTGAAGVDTLSGAQHEAAAVEGDVNTFLPIVAALVPGAGTAIAAGVTGAEAITNSILDATNHHAPPLTIAAGAVNAAIANAAPVLATLPAADAAKASGIARYCCTNDAAGHDAASC